MGSASRVKRNEAATELAQLRASRTWLLVSGSAWMEGRSQCLVQTALRNDGTGWLAAMLSFLKVLCCCAHVGVAGLKSQRPLLTSVKGKCQSFPADSSAVFARQAGPKLHTTWVGTAKTHFPRQAPYYTAWQQNINIPAWWEVY